MNQLHLIQTQLTIQQFEYERSLYLGNSDSILFLNDGLYTLQELSVTDEGKLSLNSMPNTLYVLSEQLSARSLTGLAGNERIQSISYSEFVNLSINATKVVSW